MYVTICLRKNIRRLGYPIAFLATVLLSSCGSADNLEERVSEEETALEVVQISELEQDEFGIETEIAGPGVLTITSRFPGEVRVNQDRFTHIVPRVSGVVHSVFYSTGDSVKAGALMAVIDSRELADIKSEYLATVERAEIAEVSFIREAHLYRQKISSEAEYLEAETSVAEAQISLRSARQKLLALGFSEDYIRELPDQPEHSLVHYEIRAPICGTVLERHISPGEAVDSSTDAFAVADLSRVWIDLEIFQKDLDLIKEQQEVHIASTGNRVHDTGIIRFVRPVVGEETRTALARIILENQSGVWRPGMFVNGDVTTSEVSVDLMVPLSAVVQFEGEGVVFREYEGGFTPSIVTLGSVNSEYAEVVDGLEPGQRIVTEGSFTLKAQLEKSELEAGHGH